MYTYQEVCPNNVHMEGLRSELRLAFPTTFSSVKSAYDPRQNNLTVWMVEELDDAGKAALQAAVNAHTAESWQVRIAPLCIVPLDDPYAPPIDLDFSVGLKRALQKVNVRVWQGDVLQTIYYENINDHNIPTDPVVQWDTKVVYSSTHIDVYDTISWALRNGQLHPRGKQLHQRYSGQRWLDWLEGKRSQIIAWLRWNVASAMINNLVVHGDGTWSVGKVMVEGGAFFRDHGANIQTYISGYDPTAITAIQEDTRTWLDGLWYDNSMTIRANFLEQMKY